MAVIGKYYLSGTVTMLNELPVKRDFLQNIQSQAGSGIVRCQVLHNSGSQAKEREGVPKNVLCNSACRLKINFPWTYELGLSYLN